MLDVHNCLWWVKLWKMSLILAHCHWVMLLVSRMLVSRMLVSRMLKTAVLRLVVSRMLVRRAMRKATIIRLQAVRHHHRLTILLVTRGVPSLMLGMLVPLGRRLSLGCLSSLRNTLPNIGQCIADGKRDVLTMVASARSSGVVQSKCACCLVMLSLLLICPVGMTWAKICQLMNTMANLQRLTKIC